MQKALFPAITKSLQLSFLSSFLLFPNAAWGVADSVHCLLSHIPGEASPRPALVYIDGISQEAPLVALYGRQVMPLQKKRIASAVLEFQSSESAYLFRFDEERNRLLVSQKSPDGSTKAPSEGGWIAGNCERI